jgi:trk system potassium uptake protein TrkA
MYVIVIGGGKVGYYLAKSLKDNNVEVLLVEKDPARAQRVADELGAEMIFRGDGSEARVMEQFGMGRADVVCAVTGDDEDNLVICQMAKQRFHVPRAIARVNNPRNQAIFYKLGIDVTVSSTDIILAQIEQSIPRQSIVHLLTLQQAGIRLLEVRLEESSPALGRPLKSLGMPDGAILSVVIRNGRATVPSGDTVLQANDEVIAVASAENEEPLRRILAGR